MITLLIIGIGAPISVFLFPYVLRKYIKYTYPDDGDDSDDEEE